MNWGITVLILPDGWETEGAERAFFWGGGLFYHLVLSLVYSSFKMYSETSQESVTRVSRITRAILKSSSLVPSLYHSSFKLVPVLRRDTTLFFSWFSFAAWRQQLIPLRYEGETKARAPRQHPVVQNWAEGSWERDQYGEWLTVRERHTKGD